MKIETKFSLGQEVYPIRKYYTEEFIQCNTCDGLGKLKIENKDISITCTKCYGDGGKKVWANEKWHVQFSSFSKIGKVYLEIYSKKFDSKTEYKYMIEATGVGSGTVWYEHDLFLTLEEAQQECDNRNKMIKT